MKISLKLILDELGLAADMHLPDGANPKFKSVELYVAGESPLDPDVLYICTLTEAAANTDTNRCGEEWFLCAREQIENYSNENVKDNGVAAGIIVVRDEIGMRDLFNRVQRVFVKITQWIVAMERSISKRDALQELLDLSELIFGNFIAVQDGTFKLVAHTKNIEPPGDVMQRIVRLGYHPPETMTLFQKHRKIEDFKTRTDVIVSCDRLTCDHDIVRKTFRLGGSMHIIVVMECNEKAANDAVVELFGVLLEYIEMYLKLEVAQTGGTVGGKSLLFDILDKSAGSREEARIRATYCGYPFEGDFRLYVFSFDDESNVAVEQHTQLLLEMHPNSVTFSRDRKVFMIDFQSDDIDSACKSSEKAMAGAGFKCGISNSFNCLWALPVAYEQAVAALDISSRLRFGKAKCFHYYSDYLVYHVVSASLCTAQGAFENSLLSRSVALLNEYDRQQNTETMTILRLFLENERRATTVASIMHLHRNTVLYHIQKASDLLRVSLDDSETRLQLLLAFKAHDFNTK